jgi:hypothetical protein
MIMSTRRDYIPEAHDKFFRWQGDFYNRVTEKLSSFKIEESKLKDVTAAKSKYELAFQRASNPDSANRADRVERDERAAAYKAAIRQFVNENIRYNSNISDYDKQYLGLTIADTKPTPAPVPVTHPVIKVDFSEPRRHTLHIHDEDKSGRAKPEGVKEAEIWYKIADSEPANQSEMQYAGSTSKNTFLIEFDIPERGKKVWYNASWVNTRGAKGPWGEFENAFIA